MRKQLLGTLLGLFCVIGTFAQSTLTTVPPLTGGNGSAGVSFNLETNSAIFVTEILNAFQSTNQTVNIWFNNTPISGSPNVSTANGWTIIETTTLTGLSAGLSPVLSTITLSNPLLLQPGSYAFFVEGSSSVYTTWSASNQDTFTDGVITIYTGQNIGYGGSSPNPGNHPRQFNGGVTYNIAAPCVAPPTAGSVAMSDTGACANINFDLSLVSATMGSGMTYQWQSSPDSLTWSNMAGGTTPVFTTSQTVETYYRCIVTCSGQSDTTAGVYQTINPYFDCYCTAISYYGCGSYGNIANVQIPSTTLNNSTGCSPNSYEQYTGTPNTTATLVRGNTYTMDVLIGGTTTIASTAYFWIDYNQSGSFDPGEGVYLSGGANVVPGQTATATFTVPINATPGNTGLRVKASYYAYPIYDYSACYSGTNFYYGEIEDYVINIIEPPVNDAGLAQVDTPFTPACVTPSELWVTLANSGTSTLSSATVNWTVNGTAQAPLSWTGSVASFSTDTVSTFVGNYSFVPGDVIEVWTSLPNGVQDSLSFNDTLVYTVLPTSLNGTYTIDPSGTGANNYVDFTSAITDLNNSGVCGPVVFNVADGVYNEELNFGTIMGASTTNTITFQSTSGDTSACIVEYAPSGASYQGVVRFQTGASFVKIKELGIHNISTSATYGTAVSVEGDVEGVELENNRIVAFGTSASGAIYKTSSAHALNVKFLNNTILNGYYGLYWYGSSSNYDEGTEFIGNEFSGMGYYGNYIWYQSDIKYNNNHIVPSTSTYYAVYNSYFDGHIEINGNFLDTDPSNTYTYYGFYLRYIYGDPYDRAQIYGNRVRTNNYYTSYLYYLDFADVRNNTFVCTSTSTGARAAYIYYGDYNVYYNNLFVNLGSGYSIYHLGSGVTEMDNNAYASAGSSLSYWSGANADLSALQSSSGMNDNSVEVVVALSDTLQMLVCNDSLNNVGISTPNYTADFQGDPVDQNAVDIGADQFMLPADFDMIDTTGYCDGDTITLEVFYFDSAVWNLGQHIGTTFEVSQYGSYIVDVYGVCGMATDTVYVEESEPVDLPSVSLICYMDTSEIATGVNNAQSYAWSTGASTSTISVTTEGQYSVTVVDKYGCESTDITTAEFTEPVDLADTTFLCESVGTVSINSGMAGSYAWTTGASSQSINVTADGTYGVTVTDNNNCVTSDETEVVSLADPVADFGGYVLYYNVNFTNNSSGTSYHWDFGDGNTSTDENPSHTYAWTNDSITYYTVTLTVTNACGVDSVTYEVGVGDGAGNGPLGVSELAEGTQVNVYPNPSNGFFNVAFTNVENEEVTVQVYDIQGKQVITRNYGVVSGNQSENLNIENVSAGIYFMNVQIGDDKEVIKLIVE